jgi:hypothetical protein
VERRSFLIADRKIPNYGSENGGDGYRCSI